MFYLFIINPTAGSKDSSKELMSEIKQIFKTKPFQIEVSQYAGHAIELVNTYSKLYEKLTVFACGGDGTVNEVVNGIKENKNITLAIIPIGTGNDFIRNYTSKAVNLSAYLDLEATPVDLMKIENRYGLNVISSGFDADVAQNMNKFRKLGKNAYYASISYTLLQSLKHPFEFVIDDAITLSKKNYLMGICANGKYYGRGMLVSPYSNITSGKMNFISIKVISRLQIPNFMKIFIKGRHIDELPQYIDTIKCNKVKFKSKNPITVSIDGEIHTMYNPTIQLIEKGINLLIPKNEAD